MRSPEDSSDMRAVENTLVKEYDRHLCHGQSDGVELRARKVDFVEPG
jgi:hypothetical protein